MYQNRLYAIGTLGAPTALASTATATAVQSFPVFEQIKVTRIYALISTAVVCPTSAGVYTFFRRPTLGSDVGIVAIGTLTIPDGTAKSKVVFADVNTTLVPGDELVIKCTTASVGAGNAGAALFEFTAEENTEDYRDQTNMIKSA